MLISSQKYNTRIHGVLNLGEERITALKKKGAQVVREVQPYSFALATSAGDDLLPHTA